MQTFSQLDRPDKLSGYDPLSNVNGMGETDNEIDTSSNFHQFNNKPQPQDYVCGRAVTANRAFDYTVSRTKYRPIEIRMPRVIGGDETDPGEFPWAASIKLNGQPICGGSLIGQSWILTAAHCVVGYNPKNLTVRLGAYRIKDQGESQAIEVPVSMFIVHKDYSVPRPFSNDIALLMLKELVRYTDFIIPICLPFEDQESATGAIPATVNEYANNFDTGKEMDDSGIVISTKMSDYEIAKCFNKLEQNYLNSIGLGLSSGTSETDSISSLTLTTHKSPQTTESPPEAMSPDNSQKLAFSYTDLFNSILLPIDSQTNKLNLFTPIKQTQDVSSEDPAMMKHEHHSSLSVSQNEQQAYYKLPWTSRKSSYLKVRSLPQTAEGLASSRKDSGIKLSRLPMSNELIREIQSMGSMPSLNLGIQQGDIAAMASDLIHGGPSPTSFASSHREKITSSISDDMRPNQQVNSVQSNHQRHNGMLSEDQGASGFSNDDATRYSGLQGIVVGWGWIRELDGDDQVSSKGFPSVTLQKVRLPILRNKVCEAWFQSQSKKITLLPSQFCAGFQSGGKDACRVSKHISRHKLDVHIDIDMNTSLCMALFFNPYS